MPCSQHGMDPKFKVGETPKTCSSQDTVLPSSKRPTSAAFVLPETVCLEGPCYNARCVIWTGWSWLSVHPQSLEWIDRVLGMWTGKEEMMLLKGERQRLQRKEISLFKVSLEDNFGGEDGIHGQNLVYRKGQMCSRDQMVWNSVWGSKRVIL